MLCLSCASRSAGAQRGCNRCKRKSLGKVGRGPDATMRLCAYCGMRCSLVGREGGRGACSAHPFGRSRERYTEGERGTLIPELK